MFKQLKKKKYLKIISYFGGYNPNVNPFIYELLLVSHFSCFAPSLFLFELIKKSRVSLNWGNFFSKNETLQTLSMLLSVLLHESNSSIL